MPHLGEGKLFPGEAVHLDEGKIHLGESKLLLGEAIRLGEGGLRLGEPEDSCRHCSPVDTVLLQC